MTLASDLADAIQGAMGDTGDIVETVYYTQSGGSETAIVAHVFREYPEESPTHGRAPKTMPRILVWVHKDDVDTVTPNVDTVRLYRDIGDSSYKTFVVHAIESQDASSYTLRVS